MLNGMIYRINILLLFWCTLLSCNRTKEKIVSESNANTEYYNREHLIEAEELATLSKTRNIKIIDFRKREKYLIGHIPNALNIWRTDIEDTNYPYKGMMANKETLEKLFSSLGIAKEDIVIAYDDIGLRDAAGLWWVLKTYNFNNVKLLNGGWHAWKEIKGKTSIRLPQVSASTFSFPQTEEKALYASMTDVSRMISLNNESILLDTRTPEEYSGEQQKKGAKRNGRIPKSINVDWKKTIDYSKSKKFKSRAALEKIYDLLGSSKDKSIVAYCHTGVRSAHTTFVLTELLGYTNVKNYNGSWSEWSYYKDLPIEKDSSTVK